MAETKPSTSSNTSSEEARNLVNEAAEAERAGDKSEARFLMDAAKDLDPTVTKAKATGGKV